MLNTDTNLDDDSIIWNTLAYSSSKAKDIVTSKVSEVRKWCKTGSPPHAPTLSYTTPIINAQVPPELQQQPEYTSHFRAILHPPKTLPPVSTHQYNTRLRRIFFPFTPSSSATTGIATRLGGTTTRCLCCFGSRGV